MPEPAGTCVVAFTTPLGSTAVVSASITRSRAVGRLTRQSRSPATELTRSSPATVSSAAATCGAAGARTRT
ncbi:MAG: hypothetical protein ACT4QF_14490 [Sporichthyaceae bacterium]